MTAPRVSLPLLLVVWSISCGSPPRPPETGVTPRGKPPVSAASGRLPPIPSVSGPLRIQVVYPAENDLIDVSDSTFLYGSVGNGAATLQVNDQPVRVWPNGAWLAWLALSPDSVLSFRIHAATATDTATLEYPVRRARRFQGPATGVWIDSTSLRPASRVWWPRDEYLPLSVRAAEGAQVRLRLPDGSVIPFAADIGPGDVPAGIRAFDRDTGNLIVSRRADRYLGAIRGVSLGEPPGPLIGGLPGPSTDSAVATSPGPGVPAPLDSGVVVEAIIGNDTARVRWPLRVALLDSTPRLVEFNDDTAGKGTTDSLTIGRARPGATYHWFFPTGTRAVVSGRQGEDLRVRLDRNQEAWVPVADAVPLADGTPALRGTVSSFTVTPSADRVTVRIPVSQRIPFRVEEGEGELGLRLYNAVGDVNWIRYGSTDPYLRDIRWQQQAEDEVMVTVRVNAPVWGFRARWVRNDLLLEIRRPPRIDRHRPLAGRLIMVDPGHPPLGATGPTGLREAEANLGVGLVLRDLLVEGGARVVMTRTTDASVDLLTRVRQADSVSPDLLISVHNNGLPDGVNPFTNNGASVFYNHLQSLPLAQEIQGALVERLGLRDLGAARGDLALVRPSWMPAVLTEGLFMMLPDQEAALRTEAGRLAYGLAIRDGVVAFLKRVAAGRVPGVP